MKLTNLQKQELIQDYLTGMSWNALCEKYSTNLHTIHTILKSHNITKTRIKDSSWSQNKQNLFKEMYLSNCTYSEMYKALSCKGGTLTYWVHKLNLPMRGSGRNNNYTNKFTENTVESNYWLGYIFADGHISYNPNKRVGSISLTSEKKYVVEKFKHWYENKPAIYKRKYITLDGTEKYIYSALLCDTKIAKWFNENLNVENKKHHTLNPNINLNWDIIRGYFDGDGSSSKGEWQLKSCSKIWLERIQYFINQYNIPTLLKISYKDCWGLYAYKKSDALKIAKLMYKNNYYCHNYKYQNYEPYISNDVMKTE